MSRRALCFRHSRTAVPGIEPLADLLPEHKGSKKSLKLVKVVSAQTPHRLIQGKIVGILGRELGPDRLPILNGEANMKGNGGPS
jgi:hypothetical protein